MAARNSRGRSSASGIAASPPTLDDRHYTGRYLVVFGAADTGAALMSLRQRSGLRVASSSDFADRAVERPDDTAYALYFEALGIALVDAPPEQLAHVTAAGTSNDTRMIVVPERYLYAAGTIHGHAPGPVILERDYLKGYRDGVMATVEHLLGRDDRSDAMPHRSGLSAAEAAAATTWSLARAGVPASQYSGRGIKLAVLDTGFDIAHPDFAGRSFSTRSFVPDGSIVDVHGHGTHCTGIACGSRVTATAGPRYGAASDAEILVGKVLGDGGKGDEAWVLNGINWALEAGADIVSLSIEGYYDASHPVLPQYEAIGTRALAAGRLVIAAAGNDSARPLYTRPVASPASASTIMAVAAIGPDDRVASFSCAGGPGGLVDIAAPGVSIESSAPMPRGRRSDSGTSAAAPLVAGIAALFMESDPALKAQVLWDRLVKSARVLKDASSDVGAGCVNAS